MLIVDASLLANKVEAFVVLPLTLVVMLGIVGLIVWLVRKYEKKRTENLAAIAQELGLEFTAEGSPDLQEKLSVFPMFNKGRSRKMKNVMTAETESTGLAIFEYQYTTGSGKQSQTHRFTMAAMQTELALPHFTVRPEGFLDRIGSAMGFQDIDFENHPEFSNAFVLKGHNEVAIRQFFDQHMLDLFANNRGVYVDANGGLLTFRKPGRLKPEQISEFMAEAYEFLSAFGGPEES
ncbi:hypothetical protein [Mariniblastus fucicola]|uniref:DUF3137 domain-containing protein n=1 Tax=Mariniblastus fucicola TaxID=980251 RepID=A0A5B9P7B4_9BACT|nr:hypothetical protein [Mariniblastus fucicola]QEG20832.1 hypothetical protein MFFC18_06830 [Mariniblastus fucicola]